MCHGLGFLRCPLLLIFEKAGLILRLMLLKKKCLDISSFTETQGVHLLGHGGIHGEINEPSGPSNGYV